jgi:hypothetical protein
MSIPEFLNLAMFAIAGATLSHVNVSVIERPIPFLIIMVCMAVVNITARIQ